MILDVGLPGMSGYEVAEHLRTEPTTRSAVLIAVTGWGTAGGRRRATAAGFAHHLTKPVDPAVLERIVNAT